MTAKPERCMHVSSRILIAGVGNVLLTDDGVGVQAIWELQRHPIPGVQYAEIGTAILHGLHFLESVERVLVIDAARGGQPPGTIYLFNHTADAPLPAVASVHALGLREAMRLLPPDIVPPAVTVLGVEPASLEYGMNLTAALHAVLPAVVGLARQTVLEWLAERSVLFFAPPARNNPTVC